MKTSKPGLPAIRSPSRPLQVGFLPVFDCAPIVFALESGLFAKYELRVELRRENRWENIRDRVIYGELDAAHAYASLPFVTNLGLDSDQCATVIGLVLGLEGNAVTLSRELWDEGVRDGATLRDLVYRNWGKRTRTLAVPCPYAPPYFVLRRWLRMGGIRADAEIRIVTLPSSQMLPTLKLGYIDGFCAGAPWDSLAVEAGVGVAVAGSSDLAPLHPEKVLMVRRDFAAEHADEHERLIAALIEACAFCDRPENLPLLAEMLGRQHYVNAPAECMKAIPPARPEAGDAAGAVCRSRSVFHRHNANEPTDERAAWLLTQLHHLAEEQVLKPSSAARSLVIKNVFRRDIYERARGLVAHQARVISSELDEYAAAWKRTA